MLLERVVGFGLTAMGVYFAVLIVRGLLRYQRFRRVRSTALLTWAASRAHLPLLVTLGVVNLLITVANGLLHRPLHHVVSLGLMAAYFALMVPLAARIDLGLYRDGVWAETGFVPWERIARLAFREGPQIVLVLVTRGRSGPFRLPVPPDEYGAVRKVLEEKVRSHALKTEPGILGL
jgi:hypothetical protein